MSPSAQIAVRETGNYLGLVEICPCGIPECGSPFAWIKDRVVLSMANTMADIPYNVRILPAVINL